MRKILFVMVPLLLIPTNVFSQINTAFWGNKSVICDLASNKDKIFGNSNEFYKLLDIKGEKVNENTNLQVFIKNDGSVFVTEGNNEFFCITFIGGNIKLYTPQK